MPSNASPRSARRPALLAGSAVLALLLTATAAQAQSGTAIANGPQALANQQSLRNGVIVADASGVQIGGAVTGDLDREAVTVSDDSVAIIGKGNAAKLALVSVAASHDHDRAAHLTSRPDAGSATGTAVIANHQSLNSESVIGDFVGRGVSIRVGDAGSSEVVLSENALDTTTVGNELVAELSTAEGGGGLASSQQLSLGWGLAARARGGFAVTTGALTNSRIESSSNLDRAIAAGNSAASFLSLEAPVLTLDNRIDTASTVATEGAVVVNGTMAASVYQSASGVLKAILMEDDGNPTLSVRSGDTTSSSIISDRNTLTAIARGNFTTTAGTVTAAAIRRANDRTDPPSPIGAIATAQKADELDVRAFAVGDISVTVDGDALRSDISNSRNLMQTIAAANQSDSLLYLTATAIDADRGRGLATVDTTGVSTANAGAVVQSVQDYGSGPVRASQFEAKIGVKITGTVDGSHIAVDGNSDRVAATGNDAANRLTAAAVALGTSLAVNSLQSGNGDVLASLGSAGMPGEFGIAVEEGVTNASLSVSGNSFLGSAIGNLGTNDIGVTAGTMGGTSGVRSQSGAIGEDYGAVADVALAGNQKLGEPTNDGTLVPSIQSQVFTLSGIVANGGAGSTFAVEDNVQQATALGNTISNALSVDAATLGEAGTGLASSQYGQANVGATSGAQLLSASQTSAASSLSGNSNAALAAINEAANALAVDAGTALGTGGSAVASGGFGPPTARGDHVLSSQQFAIGSAAATVTTAIVGRAPAAGSEGSTYRVTGNRTSGEASANRAVNTVSVSAIDGTPGAGLANTQMNAATVQVSAAESTSVPLGSSASGSEIVIGGNTVSALARGNAAENSIAVSAGAVIPGVPGRAEADRFGAEASGGAALLNVQTNFAPVTATAIDTGLLVPLNAGILDGSRVSISGNSVSATGYGNAATNSVSVSGLSAPSVAIANSQVNTGNVYAVVNASRLDGGAGSLGAASFSMTGNQLSATAVGNQVSSAITGLR